MPAIHSGGDWNSRAGGNGGLDNNDAARLLAVKE
jgi:hypothetical protein